MNKVAFSFIYFLISSRCLCLSLFLIVYHLAISFTLSCTSIFSNSCQLLSILMSQLTESHLSQFISPLLSHLLWRLILNSRLLHLTRTLLHFLILSLPLYLGVFQSTFSLLLRSQSHSLKLTKTFFVAAIIFSL